MDNIRDWTKIGVPGWTMYENIPTFDARTLLRLELDRPGLRAFAASAFASLFSPPRPARGTSVDGLLIAELCFNI